MNFDEALRAHVRWSLQFKDAIEGENKLDIATISAADRCELGQWLHGEAREKYGALEAYAECVECHALLHQVAGQLAQRINEGNYALAAALLHDGSPYTEASLDMATALAKLRKEVVE